MIEIEIAFEYFEEGFSSITSELEEAIESYKDNYLVYYIFSKNYCIFSNIEITKNEAEVLVNLIESDKGLDMLYSDGIQTDYAKYIMFKKEEVKKDEQKEVNKKAFEDNLERYVQNVTKLNKINELVKKNELYKNKIEELKEDNNIIIESKALLEEYQKLVNDKDKEINKLKENNIQMNENMKRIPKLVRIIFLRKNKLLN